jgi:ABC-type sugar transport systems, permease components
VSTNTETVTTGAPAEAPPKGKPQLSEGARAERRLGFMLIAPAVIVMIAVTAYPVVYAIYLSLERYNLALPQAKKFIGFANYGAVLSSPYWWHALYVTVSSRSSRWPSRWCSASCWPSSCTGRYSAGVSSAPPRSLPYGIVTVAAAYSWQYAWTPGQGYLSSIFNNSAPLTNQFQAIVVIIIAEIWKTTPFMALLLLADCRWCRKTCRRPRRWTAPRPGSASRRSRCR